MRFGEIATVCIGSSAIILPQNTLPAAMLRETACCQPFVQLLGDRLLSATCRHSPQDIWLTCLLRCQFIAYKAAIRNSGPVMMKYATNGNRPDAHTIQATASTRHVTNPIHSRRQAANTTNPTINDGMLCTTNLSPISIAPFPSTKTSKEKMAKNKAKTISNILGAHRRTFLLAFMIILLC